MNKIQKFNHHNAELNNRKCFDLRFVRFLN